MPNEPNRQTKPRHDAAYKSTVDRRMALRMMDYAVRILRGLDKEDLGPAGVHPPILPVVI